MAKAAPAKLSPAKLREAFKQDIARAWEHLRRKYPKEQPYAVVLYGVEDPILLWPNVLTEESLTAVAQASFKDGFYDTLEEARKGLRWNVADSPREREFAQHGKAAEALLGPHKEGLYETGYKPLLKPAMEAMKELDEAGLFGKTEARNKILLAILTDDAEGDWSDLSAKRLNPEAVYKRFRDATIIEGVWAKARALAVSADERFVFGGGCRENPARRGMATDSNVEEVVGYHLRGRSLARRWTFTFPGRGASVYALSCSADGKSVVAVGTVYTETGGQSMVMRFGCADGKLLEMRPIDKEAGSLAMSADGNILAVATRKKSIIFLDATFSTLRETQLAVEPMQLLFLKSGELLVSSDSALFRLQGATGKRLSAYKLESFDLSSDAAEKMLAVSRYFRIPEMGERPAEESGVRLLRLSEFKLLRTILVPTHQSMMGTLSPDGRLMAVHAQGVVNMRDFVVVLETASGREIARRKDVRPNQMCFLRDNRTLLIARDGEKPEPIDVWQIDVEGKE